MDFLDPKKKRAHKIRLYVGYLLMAIALSIGSFILLMEAYGYDVNRKTGDVIQNGMLFVDAHPESAEIYLNDKREGETRSRLVLPSGDYHLELRRTGYKSWNRHFRLLGSEIERLDYAFLVPEQLTTSDIQLYGTDPSFATQSPDRKWVLIQKPTAFDEFDVVDLSTQGRSVEDLKLPSGLMAANKKNRKLELVEWSTDNRHVLLRHSFTGGFEFIRVDREQPNQSLNLNKAFQMNLLEVALRNKKFDKLHLLEAKTENLFFGDSKNQSKQLVTTKVKAFKSYGDDHIIYVTTQNAAKGEAQVRIRQNSDDYLMRELSLGQNFMVDITRYDDSWYMAVSDPAGKRVLVYRDALQTITRRDNPLLPAPIAVLRLAGEVQNISFSANTRFLGAQSGSEFAVYDAEHDEQYRYDTKLKLDTKTDAVWMDGHRYMVSSGSKAVIFDYDGINKHTLVPANKSQIFFDRDYDFLYTIGNSVMVKGRPALTQTSMRTVADQ